jgi:hypothetical protein
MRSLTNALNNIAAAINNVASVLNRQNNNISSKTITSNGGYQGTKITTYQDSIDALTVRVDKKEHAAMVEIFNAITDKGNYPHNHDDMMQELQTKWPVLYKALNNLVKVRSYSFYANYAKQDKINSKEDKRITNNNINIWKQYG